MSLDWMARSLGCGAGSAGVTHGEGGGTTSDLGDELDDRNEKLGYRIRDAQVRKVPYMLVVGEREAQNGTASLRRRTGEDVGAVPVERIVAELIAEIGSRSATLTVGHAG